MSYGSRLTILEPTNRTDEYGNVIDDWSTTVALDEPASVGVSDTSEQVSSDRDSVVTRYRVHLRAGVPVEARHRIAWLGDLYEIDGDIERHMRGGQLHHLEFFIRRQEG